MFYMDTAIGVSKILMNLCLDKYNLESIDKETFSNLMSLDENKQLFKFISCITKSKYPLSYDFIKMGNKPYYIHNMNIFDIYNINTKMSFSGDNIIEKSYQSDTDRMIKFIEKNDPLLANLYNGNSINNNIEEFICYKNDRDSVLYLSDISSLENDISITRDSQIFHMDELNKLYSITVRLILPKILADKIECKNKLMFLHLPKFDTKQNKYRAVFKYSTKRPDHTQFAIGDYKDLIELDTLPLSTLYKVYLNMTFSELTNMLNTVANYESNYDEQVIGGLYYSLIHHENIKTLMQYNLNQGVDESISARIHYRRGN